MAVTKRSQLPLGWLILVLNLCIQIVFIYCISALFLALPFWPYFFWFVTDLHALTSTSGSILTGLEIVWRGVQSIPLYPPNELAHLVDVHWLIVRTLLLIPLLLTLVKLIKVKIPYRVWQVTLFGWIALTAIILITFPFFFETFHHLFFPQGNYAFDPHSRLIMTFPLPFWVASFGALQFIVIAWLGWKVSRAAAEKF